MRVSSTAAMPALRATAADWGTLPGESDAGGHRTPPAADRIAPPASLAQAVQQTLQAAPGDAQAPEPDALMHFAHALAHVLRGDDDGPGRHRGRAGDDDGEGSGHGRRRGPADHDHEDHRRGLREYRALDDLAERIDELATRLRAAGAPAASPTPPAAPQAAPASPVSADGAVVTPDAPAEAAPPHGERWLRRLLQAFDSLQPAAPGTQAVPPDGSGLRERLARFLEQLADALQATPARACGCGQLLNLDA